MPFIQAAQSALTSISTQASNGLSELQNNVTSQLTNVINKLNTYQTNAKNLIQELTLNLTNQLNSEYAIAQNCSSKFSTEIQTLNVSFTSGIADCINQSAMVIISTTNFIVTIRNNTEVAVQNELNKLQNCIANFGTLNPFDFSAQLVAISCIRTVITDANNYGQTIGSQISNAAIQYELNLQTEYLKIQSCISNYSQNALSQGQQLNVLIQQCLNN